jgi:hypothetical protein
MTEQKVTVENDSAERVAYDLMERIASLESGEHNREYFLTLYCQCLKATSGYTLSNVLKDEKPAPERR